MKTTNIGFMVMAETGALRRAVERVEKCALELEQAVADLNATRISVEINPMTDTERAQRRSLK